MNSNEKQIKGTTSRNIIHIEILRIIAVYFVLFNHTGNNGFYLFSIAQKSIFYPLYLALSVVDRVAVPIYFMISGALLLGKEESIRVVYRKRILKFLIILLLVSFCYDIYFNEGKLNIKQSIVSVYTTSGPLALWYLYSYLGVLVMLPLLRKLASAMETKDYVYLGICQIVFVGIIPITQFVLSKGTVRLNSSFTVAIITSQNIFYVLMGYFFEKVLDAKYFNLKNILAANLFGVAAVVVTCFVTHYSWKLTGKYTAFHNNLISIPTFALYISVKYVFKTKNISAKAKSIITLLSGTTFGIYLLERMLRDQTIFVFYFLQPFIHTLPACIIWIFVACSIGCLVTMVLKKAPVIKELLK